uniref:Thioredoxin domain-containing protein 17 n=1 Tax=Lepeophtheirus salmonis TaxID=72036 RepID=D3PHN2_LEPSM|nr:Thioredoxin domain-containing protein 17 [Lepeophtheirus salmonis]
MKADVHGYEGFLSKVKEMEALGGTLAVLFTGSIDPSSGKSWCPDCVVAEPIVDSVMKDKTEVHFLRVFVGPRDFWKDPQCPFRTNPDTRLKSIPTLIIWKSQSKLDGYDITDPNLIAMLFED